MRKKDDLDTLAILSLVTTFEELKETINSLQKQLQAIAKRHGVKILTTLGTGFAIAATSEIMFNIDFAMVEYDLGFFAGVPII